jgi:tRNA-Thr(GGU) m(6)t(6)A37 methyltransferase TsaA
MATITPVGTVRSGRTGLDDDSGWDAVPARIELDASYSPEALAGLEQFSHVEVLYHLHRIPETEVERAGRHPRGDTRWPKVGIFAQRGAKRPNRIAATVARLDRVEGRTLHVVGLDAVDGSPVLDIKPVMREFLPRGEVRQPAWATEVMAGYWDGGR